LPSLRIAVMPKTLSRILMEKTSMEEGSALSTQEAAAAEVVEVGTVVDVVTLEVATATGVVVVVDLVGGDLLAPEPGIAWSLRTSLPRPPGRT